MKHLSFLYRPHSSALPWQIFRTLKLHWKLIAFFVTLGTLEVHTHVRRFDIPRPATNLDPPFYIGCQDPVLNATARANATLVMLARNKEVEGAIASVRSVQEQFNNNFGYPWVFLNDEPWVGNFVDGVRAAVEKDGGGAVAHFETIPKDMWGYPDWIDQRKAQRNMYAMQKQDMPYAGNESYHHMCRFNSGFFYDHPALREYRWYWRVEPDVSFTCAITYDPFVEMERNDKRYGYTLALWEVAGTVSSLFHSFSEYMSQKRIPANSLWKAMREPSRLPWPLRRLASWLPYRDRYGDLWNFCHFWSNFEIADMDFFRSQEYRDLFAYLDQDGGFYYERWGDAPVHSLAAAMLLRPDQVHHFADIGYVHDGLQYCTFGSTPEQLVRGELVPRMIGKNLKKTLEQEQGCRCTCDRRAKLTQPVCFNRLRRTVM